MNILICTAHPYIPEMYGGLQSSSNQLASLLKKRGHRVALLSALIGSGRFGFLQRVKLKLSRQPAVRDLYLGYPAWRAWFPWEAMPYVISKEKPDIVVVLASKPVKMALAAQEAGAKVIMMLQDVEFNDHGGDFKLLGDIPCVANSAFTAETYHKSFAISPKVIHPMVDANKYQTQTSRENVTYINPHPSKGVDIVLAAARACPDIPFAIYKSWPLSVEERASLNEKLSGLSNVKLHPPTRDMKSVYGKARILMAPSKWQEAYGRVASEAQFNGIPVIASNRGGLPEAVGDGGILLDPDGPIEPWINAVRRLWDDKEYYKDLSEKAQAYAQRPALNQLHQMDMWEENILKAAGKK